MRYCKLGGTGFKVGEIGYGVWGIGQQWLGRSGTESLAALRAALECGLNLINTALAYGEGHSQGVVGQVVRAAGRRVYIGSQVPPKNMVWPARPGVCISNVFPYRYILESTEHSLKDLGLETIDVQQLHGERIAFQAVRLESGVYGPEAGHQ